MDETACNYDADATLDDDSCDWVCGPDVVLEFGTDSDGNLNVNYNSNAAISGFQFDISHPSPPGDISINDVYGGAAGDAGFSFNFSDNLNNATILVFSMSGGSIPAGSGVLTVVSYTGSGEACFSNVVIAGSVSGDALDSSHGDCATLDYTPPVITTTLPVTYSSDADIYGFQFDVDGAELVNASGGEAAAFEISFSTETGVVLGFSISGVSISSDSGTLINLEVEGDGSGVCVTNLIVSGAGGANLDISLDCLDFSYTTPLSGCMDATACNYDADATQDDGDSCIYDDACIGCTDPYACNYDPYHTIEDGSCDYSCYGCMDETACNYDADATLDDDSCDWVCGPDVVLEFGTDSDGNLNVNYNSNAAISGFQFDI
jgi:hypothetical protein